MKIKLYEFAPTRSARARWTLLEAGLEFESVSGPELIGSDELKRVHPLGKLPGLVIDGKPLFESAAMSTYIADLVPEKGLIAAPGTYERALHDQWTAYCLTELEAWAWCTAMNTFVLPEEKRLTGGLEQNKENFARGATAVEAALADAEFLVGNRFSVTDIIMGYGLNMGKGMGMLASSPNIEAYLERLKKRPHCTLS